MLLTILSSLLSALTVVALLFLFLHTRMVTLFQDLPDERKIHSKVVPRFGGLALLLVFLTAAFVMEPINTFHNLQWSSGLLLPMVSAAFVFLLIGLLDDSHLVYFLRRMRDRRKNITYTDPKGWHFKVRYKFILEFALAIGVTWFTGFRFPGIAFMGPLAIPMTWLWLVGVANAFNIIDGVDGLCGGVSLLTMIVLAFLGNYTGCYGVEWLAIALAGGTAGFLVLNAPPAKLFLGDMGSLFLGFATALMGLRLANTSSNSFGIPFILLLAGFPILDLSTAMIRRWVFAPKGLSLKQRLGKLVAADAQHIHHRLLKRGYGHLGVSLRLYALSAIFLFGGVSMILVNGLRPFVPWIMILVAVVALFIAYWPRQNKYMAYTFSRIAGVLVVPSSPLSDSQSSHGNQR